MFGRHSGRGAALVAVVRRRPFAVIVFVLLALSAPVALAAMLGPGSPATMRASSPFSRATAGGDGAPPAGKPLARIADHGGGKPMGTGAPRRPEQRLLKKSGSAVFDVRTLHGTVIKQEGPERKAPNDGAEPPPPAAKGGAAPNVQFAALSPAPGPDSSFEGLD